MTSRLAWPPDRLARDLIFWFSALMPLWWLTGLLLPLGFVVVWLLFLQRLPQSGAALTVTGLWFGAGASQALSAMINQVERGQTVGWMLHAMTSFSVVGWFFLGACLAVGAELRLAGPWLVRVACIQCGWILLFSVVALLVSLGGQDEFFFPSPVGMLLPSSPLRTQWFIVKLFNHEDFIDASQLRLCLFFPYATVLGFGALVLGIVGSLERNRGWRLIALCGSALGLVLSYSRAALVAAGLVLVLCGLWRLRFEFKIVVFVAVAVLCNLAVLMGWDPIVAIHDLYLQLQDARAGSSAARTLIDAESWNGFLKSPLWGFGVQRRGGPMAADSAWIAFDGVRNAIHRWRGYLRVCGCGVPDNGVAVVAAHADHGRRGSGGRVQRCSVWGDVLWRECYGIRALADQCFRLPG
jgi:O-Antigen ligase